MPVMFILPLPTSLDKRDMDECRHNSQDPPCHLSEGTERGEGSHMKRAVTSVFLSVKMGFNKVPIFSVIICWIKMEDVQNWA